MYLLRADLNGALQILLGQAAILDPCEQNDFFIRSPWDEFRHQLAVARYDLVTASRYLDSAKSEDDDVVTAFGLIRELNWRS